MNLGESTEKLKYLRKMSNIILNSDEKSSQN